MKTIKRKLLTVPGFRDAVFQRCSGKPYVSVWIAEAVLSAARTRTPTTTNIQRAEQSDGDITLRFRPEENDEIDSALKELGITNFCAWARSIIMALPVTDKTAKPSVTIQRCIKPIDYPQFDMALMLNIQVEILQELKRRKVSAEMIYEFLMVFKQLEEDFSKIADHCSKPVAGNSASSDLT